jgi:hypothetical protein
MTVTQLLPTELGRLRGAPADKREGRHSLRHQVVQAGHALARRDH